MTGRRTRIDRPIACILLLVLAGLSAHVARATEPSPDQEQTGSQGFITPTPHAVEEDRQLLELFEGLRVADVSDGMDAVGLQDVGLMDPAIGPLWRDTDEFAHRFCGIAVTVRYVPTNKRAPRLGPAEFPAFEGRWYRELSPE